jgi:flagellar biosynthesis/type III secretory pathway protein FliH
MDDMTAKEEFIFLFKAYLKQAEADVKKWAKHLERLEGKTDTMAESPAAMPGSVPCWYTEKEIYTWLRNHQYSEQIAKELAEPYAENLQRAYEKGYQHGLTAKA